MCPAAITLPAILNQTTILLIHLTPNPDPTMVVTQVTTTDPATAVMISLMHHKNFVSVHHGSNLSDHPSPSQQSSSRSSESKDPFTNSNISTTFAMANTNSIPALHQPSGSCSSGNSYSSSHSATSMNNSYHHPESLSMLHHNPIHEHNSTFTSSKQASNHHSIPSRIITTRVANAVMTTMTRYLKRSPVSRKQWNS